MEKSDLRKIALRRRNSMTQEECRAKSAVIAECLFKQDIYRQAKKIGLYASYQNEVITYPLFQQSIMLDKQVAYPRVCDADKGQMQFHFVRDITELISGYRDILEPMPQLEIVSEMDLLIMPLVAFDEGCHRIGYGKGFYDRFLHENPSLPTIALAFECQKVDAFGADKYDRSPDMIITENGIYRNDGC